MDFLFIFTIFLLFLLLLVFAILMFFLIGDIVVSFSGSSFLRSPFSKVKKSLELLNLKEGEVFYDLGSGDGRVLIEAAKNYKVKAVGIELNQVLVWFSRCKVRQAGLKNLIRIEKGNFFKKDLSDADAVFIYLNQKFIDKLEKKLLKELKKGTRILLYPSFFRSIPFVKSDSEFPELKLYQI